MTWVDLELINGWKPVDGDQRPQYEIGPIGVDFRGWAEGGEGPLTRLPKKVFKHTGSGQMTYDNDDGKFTVTIDEKRYMSIEFEEIGRYGRN